MNTHEFKIFGHNFNVSVGVTDRNGKHTVTVESRDNFISHRLRCYVDPSEEFIEIWSEHPLSKTLRSGKWVKIDTDIKFRMSEYHFAALLGKWMALTYLTIQYDLWIDSFIPTVSEQSGYKIYKEPIGTNIVSENTKTGHKVVFISSSEEDGMRYLAEDSRGEVIEHFSFYNWEFERSCVGVNLN